MIPSQGVVSHYLVSLIAQQVENHGIVVWYDPDKMYATLAHSLGIPNTEVFCYKDSFFQLRWHIDQKNLMEGELPPRMVVYVPMAQEKTHHALIELEVAGVVVQPGQHPSERNTSLAVVARNALKGVLGEQNLAEVIKQVEEGKLSLEEIDLLGDKNLDRNWIVLYLIFKTETPQEIALLFLTNPRFDELIQQKKAKGELLELLRKNLGFECPEGASLEEIRQRLARYVLMTDFIEAVGTSIPISLASIPIAQTTNAIDACRALATEWRVRSDLQDSYRATARHVEEEYHLSILPFDRESLVKAETFSFVEKTLLQYAENSLLEDAARSIEVLKLAELRMGRFWCRAEPQFQARWALVVSVAQVLNEADQLDQALKNPPGSILDFIKHYAEGEHPWCLLDTEYRHLESLWYNFESCNDDHDSIEKLVIYARQRYMAAGSHAAALFTQRLAKDGMPPRISIHGPERSSVLYQQDVFEKLVKHELGNRKVAYVWVDALRYEMARELARTLEEDFEVDLQSGLAAVPTITEIGMAALLPYANAGTKVIVTENGNLALQIKGSILADRRDRVVFLKEHAGVEVYDTKLDDLLPKPPKRVRENIARAQLILVTSQEIDELCEQDNISQARRQMDGVLNDLRRGLRLLAEMGVEYIILAADHGHLFAEGLSEDMKIDPPGGATIALHRRVWVGQGGAANDAVLRMSLSKIGMESEFDIATPWTFACFKAKGGARAYFHGGLSPQELVIPIMRLHPKRQKFTLGPQTGIKWTLTLGSQKITTRFLSVQVSGEHKELFEITPPRVRVELRSRKKCISQTVSASYGFDASTGDVTLRFDPNNATAIAPNTITLMIIEEIDQKSVSMYLLDAATGATLAEIEKIDVAIAL